MQPISWRTNFDISKNIHFANTAMQWGEFTFLLNLNERLRFDSLKKFVKSIYCLITTKEVTKELIWRNLFSVTVNLTFFCDIIGKKVDFTEFLRKTELLDVIVPLPYYKINQFHINYPCIIFMIK